MSFDRKSLALAALNAALRIRTEQKCELFKPICIFDLVKQLGVEVRFMEKIPTMEGMYSKNPGPVILVNTERPLGRQVFSCAHEFGHHVFNHGSRIDEIGLGDASKNTYDSKEFQADCFAGFILMPKVAIQNAFKSRGWNFKTPTPLQAYVIAGFFGVGYSTLITHMHNSLRLIDSSVEKNLLEIQPKDIRKEIYDKETGANVLVVDEQWIGCAIDLQVGDFIFASKEIILEGDSLCRGEDHKNGAIFKCVNPGIAKLCNEKAKWDSFVRISRKEYTGISEYRHLEEASDEQTN